MNRKNITHIIGITFTVCSMFLFPAIEVHGLFQKAKETAKKIKYAVVDTGTKAAVTVVGGVGKFAGTVEDSCDKISDNLRKPGNKDNNVAQAIPNAPEIPVTENIPLQTTMKDKKTIHKKKKNKSSKSDSSDSSSSSSSSSFSDSSGNTCVTTLVLDSSTMGMNSIVKVCLS